MQDSSSFLTFQRMPSIIHGEFRIKRENAGMAARGAVCIDGVVYYFDV